MHISAVLCHGTWTQLIHKVFVFFRALQEQNTQLIGSLESVNAQLSAVVAEKERQLSAVVAEKAKLTSEIQQQKANEEGLHCLLREKNREASKLQQAYDRQCQHLRNVVAFAEVSNPMNLWLGLYSLQAVCADFMLYIIM